MSLTQHGKFSFNKHVSKQNHYQALRSIKVFYNKAINVDSYPVDQKRARS